MNKDGRRLDDIVAAAEDAELIVRRRRAIAGMRDRTIHRYPDVDLDVSWDTMENDLPQLARRIVEHIDGTDI